MELNWLPVEASVTQLNLCAVHKILNGVATNYLLDYFRQVREAHRYNTRSSIANLILVRFSSQMGKGSFRYSDAQDWNTAPNEIKQISSSVKFKAKLKMLAFRQGTAVKIDVKVVVRK